MPKRENISPSVIRRLPRYYRYLALLMEEGIDRVSSNALAQKMMLTASQIRQDLNCFGGFGQQGYGYNVKLLHAEIGRILGIQEQSKAILIGAGNLGQAIARHVWFEEKGFQLVGIFDKDPGLIDTTIDSLTIQDIATLESFCKKQKPEVALLCIPSTPAEQMVADLIAYGVKGFWNFSHYNIKKQYPDIPVESVHLGDSLLTLRYHLTDRKNTQET